MLKVISIEGFKSIRRLKELELGNTNILIGPNAAGKSNFMDAIHVLSRVGESRTLIDALGAPIRGTELEVFSISGGSIKQQMSQEWVNFRLNAVVSRKEERLGYSISVKGSPKRGEILLDDEELYYARKDYHKKENRNSVIEKVENGKFHIRRQGGGSRPTEEESPLNHTILSNLRYSGKGFEDIDSMRSELSDWKTYYLDPREAMRREATPKAVSDIGPSGGDIAPFLYRLKSTYPDRFESVVRTMRSLVPSIKSLDVDLDETRGTLNLVFNQNKTYVSSRIVSEGTLRMLALASITVNPWSKSLIAFEEPENGVHPKRIEEIADLLEYIGNDRQVIVTTHSPMFAGVMLEKAEENNKNIKLFTVRESVNGTIINPFEYKRDLFYEQNILNALTPPDQQHSKSYLLMELLRRGAI